MFVTICLSRFLDRFLLILYLAQSEESGTESEKNESVEKENDKSGMFML